MKNVILGITLLALTGCSSLGSAFDSYLAYINPETEVQILVLQDRYCKTTDPIALKAIENAIDSLSYTAEPDQLCGE